MVGEPDAPGVGGGFHKSRQWFSDIGFERAVEAILGCVKCAVLMNMVPKSPGRSAAAMAIADAPVLVLCAWLIMTAS